MNFLFYAVDVCIDAVRQGAPYVYLGMVGQAPPYFATRAC